MKVLTYIAEMKQCFICHKSTYTGMLLFTFANLLSFEADRHSGLRVKLGVRVQSQSFYPEHWGGWGAVKDIPQGPIGDVTVLPRMRFKPEAFRLQALRPNRTHSSSICQFLVSLCLFLFMTSRCWMVGQCLCSRWTATPSGSDTDGEIYLFYWRSLGMDTPVPTFKTVFVGARVLQTLSLLEFLAKKDA